MSHDTLIHRAVRPVVRLARPTGVTPNQVTAGRLAAGLLAAALFATGPGAGMDAGAGVFLLSLLLDRADGELARQTGRFTARGHRLDLWADGVCTVAAFLGLGWGLRGELGWWAPVLGAAAGVSVAAVFRLVNAEGRGPPRALATRGRGVVIDPDDAMVLLPVLIWCGLYAPALALAAVVTPLVAVALGWSARQAQSAGDQAAARP